MLIVIICACIVGGMWWRTENKIKKLENATKSLDGLDTLNKTFVNRLDRYLALLKEQTKISEMQRDRITLLSKDMMQTQSNLALLQTDNNVIRDDLEVLQTTVSNLEYKSKSKKHANTKVNRSK